jgi:ArsR family transcriptional regulator
MRETLSVARALSDESRLRALMAVRGGELCLCQLIELLGLAPSTTSKHLAILQEARLIERHKKGRWAYYRLAGGDAPPAARHAIKWVVEALQGSPVIERDDKELHRVRRCDLDVLSACYRRTTFPASPETAT